MVLALIIYICCSFFSYCHSEALQNVFKFAMRSLLSHFTVDSSSTCAGFIFWELHSKAKLMRFLNNDTHVKLFKRSSIPPERNEVNIIKTTFIHLLCFASILGWLFNCLVSKNEFCQAVAFHTKPSATLDIRLAFRLIVFENGVHKVRFAWLMLQIHHAGNAICRTCLRKLGIYWKCLGKTVCVNANTVRI